MSILCDHPVRYYRMQTGCRRMRQIVEVTMESRGCIATDAAACEITTRSSPHVNDSTVPETRLTDTTRGLSPTIGYY
jgi:hypothetical protein